MSLEPWLVAAGAAVAFIAVSRLAGGRTMSSSVVQQKLQAGATIVDVRTPDEFRDGAYPRAINVPVGELQAGLARIPKDRPVVLYCASGARSAAAAMMLRRAGYADVVNAGGLEDMPAPA